MTWLAALLGTSSCDHATHLSADDSVVEAAYVAAAGSGTHGSATPAAPLRGRPGRWTYTEFPDTQCRDGSPAGVAINRGSTNKVMIYLQGGGWCMDKQTCDLNVSNTSSFANLLDLLWASGGVFDRGAVENPLRDWSFVYVPYCTGDLHSGANPVGEVPDVGPQKFVGRLNLQRFLERIAPTFPDATDIVLAGSSAGGVGALLNSLLVQRAFPGVRVKILSDSGPLLSKDVYPACLQAHQRSLWKLDDTVLADCGDACPDHDDYMLDFATFVAATLQDRPIGLLQSTGDTWIRAYSGTGNNACSNTFDPLDPGVSTPALRADLLAFRERMQPFPNFATFFADSEAHTWLWIALPGTSGDFYADSAGGVRLVDWVQRFVADEPAGQVGP